MEPFKHKLSIAAALTIAGAYTTRNAPGMDILSLEPGAEITLSPELIQQFAAVNQSTDQAKPAPVVDDSANRPQSPLAGAVSPGVASGTSTSPQAGTSVGQEGSHFGLGEVNPANGATVTIPVPTDSKAGEVKVNCNKGDTVYLDFIVPENAANPAAKGPGAIRLFALPGLDDYNGRSVLGNSPMALDGYPTNPAPNFPLLVNETATEEEKPGYSRLNVGDRIVISAEALSGPFGVQIQWPV